MLQKISQKLPAAIFGCIKDSSQFNEDFIKSPIIDVQYLERLHDLHNDLTFLPERMKIEKLKKACS